MAQKGLYRVLKELAGGCEVLGVCGELDLAVAEQLQGVIDDADHKLIIVDLGDCEFIDSTGIAVLLRAHKALAEDGRRLVLAHPTAQVLRVLSLTGLTTDGRIFDSVEDAAASR